METIGEVSGEDFHTPKFGSLRAKEIPSTETSSPRLLGKEYPVRGIEPPHFK
jgi:hypothetical protein